MMAQTIPYEVLNSLSNQALSTDNYYFSGGSRVSLSVDAATVIHDNLLQIRRAHPWLGGSTVLWEYYPMHKIMEVKPDAMAFRMRTSSKHLLIAFRWKDDDPALTPKAKALVEGLRTLLEAQLKEKTDTEDLDKDIGYGNYGTIRP